MRRGGIREKLTYYHRSNKKEGREREEKKRVGLLGEGGGRSVLFMGYEQIV